MIMEFEFKLIVFNADEFYEYGKDAVGIVFDSTVCSFDRMWKRLIERNDDWVIVDYHDKTKNPLLTSDEHLDGQYVLRKYHMTRKHNVMNLV